MPDRSRVPIKIQDFNDYIISTTNYLLETTTGTATTNWERLKITPQRKNQWVAYHNKWKNVLYPLYSTKEEKRTTAVVKQIRQLMKDFKSFTRPVLNSISGGEETTIDDLLVFNIKAGALRNSTRTAKSAITTQPFPEMNPMGGGMVKLTVRVQSDANRASMHPDADGIEMAYHIGSTPPTSPIAGTATAVYKGAIHTFDAGVENTTQRLYAYFRWKNNSNSNKSGPWSNLVQVVIA